MAVMAPTALTGTTPPDSAERTDRDLTSDAVFRLRLEPAGCDLPAPAGRTLLQAARDAGWRLPRSCQNGTCRACLCRLHSGRVAYRIEWPGLSAEERAAGALLPCVAEPRSDVVIEAPEARPALP